jgi:hypothetical protein
MVDDDETRFTASLLQGWRQRAEVCAAAAMGGWDYEEPTGDTGRWRWRWSLSRLDEPTEDLADRLLVPHSVIIEYVSNPDLHRSIYNFLGDIGALTGWGRDEAELTRMFLYEMSLNAIQHTHTRSRSICHPRKAQYLLPIAEIALVLARWTAPRVEGAKHHWMRFAVEPEAHFPSAIDGAAS